MSLQKNMRCLCNCALVHLILDATIYVSTRHGSTLYVHVDANENNASTSTDMQINRKIKGIISITIERRRIFVLRLKLNSDRRVMFLG